ncbi:MAG: thioredoxin [Candidatus Syntropharchaeia archaeon]
MSEIEEIRKKKLKEMEKKLLGRKVDEKKGNDVPSAPITLSDADIDEALKRYPVIVIDCWAAWCGPCQMIAPIIEELAREYAGKIVFGKLDVDRNPNTAMKYNIMSIPTLLVFKNGEFKGQIIGAMPKKLLEKKIKEMI